MPATAGRVKMPHNNRMHTTGALNTSSRWRDVVGFDPHASNEEAQMVRPSRARPAHQTGPWPRIMP